MVVSSIPDVILVSGLMAGERPPIESIQEIKDAVPDTPVFLNTGARKDNIAEYLKVADGVIVGTSLKKGGRTWNKVDPDRVVSFMERVTEVRSKSFAREKNP
jgi:predicted TIM-barrel enzyme